MIRINVNANHGVGVSLSKTIVLAADIYAFTSLNMGLVS